MEKKTLGSFIATLRKARGLTQQQLADYLNVSNKAVSKWECNETCPDISLIPVIAEFLEVSCDELLKGERITPFSASAEKSDKKSEKQLRFLLNKTIFKYKNISLISVLFVFAGIILMYTISYAVLRPDIAFATTCILFFVGIITQIFALNWINSKIAQNELLEENKNENHLKTVLDAKYKYSFWIFYSVLFFAFLFLPLVAFRLENVTKSVLQLTVYLRFLPLFATVPLALIFPLKHLYKGLIYKKATDFLPLFDLLQCGILFFAFLFFFYKFFFYVGLNDLTIIFYISIGLILSFIIGIIIARNKKASLKMSIITVKTLLYLFVFYLFCSSIIVYYVPQEIHFYSPFTIWISLIMTLIITFGYLFFIKRKSFYQIEKLDKGY